MTVPFISLLDLGDYLNLDLQNSQKAVIAIDSACEAVRSHIRQEVDFVADDEVHLDGTGSPSLVLPQMPVRDLTDVVLLDFNRDPITDPALVQDVDYFLELGAGIVWRLKNTCWPRGKGNVVVTYSHGYEADPEDADFIRYPSDMRACALAVAKRIYLGGGERSVTADQIGGAQYEASAHLGDEIALLPGEIMLLGRYTMRRYV